MTYKIQLNPTGTHHLEVSETALQTIRRYSLFDNLIDSNGYIDDSVLEKLRLNIRSIIAGQADCKDLLDLCIDVIYHDKMKAFGLSNLVSCYQEWLHKQPTESSEEA